MREEYIQYIKMGAQNPSASELEIIGHVFKIDFKLIEDSHCLLNMHEYFNKISLIKNHGNYTIVERNINVSFLDVIHTMSPGLKGFILNLNYGDGIANTMMDLAKYKAEGGKSDREIVEIVDRINRSSYESINSQDSPSGEADCGGQEGVVVEGEMEIMKEVDDLTGGAEMLVGDESRNVGVDNMVGEAEVIVGDGREGAGEDDLDGGVEMVDGEKVELADLGSLDYETRMVPDKNGVMISGENGNVRVSALDGGLQEVATVGQDNEGGDDLAGGAVMMAAVDGLEGEEEMVPEVAVDHEHAEVLMMKAAIGSKVDQPVGPFSCTKGWHCLDEKIQYQPVLDLDLALRGDQYILVGVMRKETKKMVLDTGSVFNLKKFSEAVRLGVAIVKTDPITIRTVNSVITAHFKCNILVDFLCVKIRLEFYLIDDSSWRDDLILLGSAAMKTYGMELNLKDMKVTVDSISIPIALNNSSANEHARSIMKNYVSLVGFEVRAAKNIYLAPNGVTMIQHKVNEEDGMRLSGVYVHFQGFDNQQPEVYPYDLMIHPKFDFSKEKLRLLIKNNTKHKVLVRAGTTLGSLKPILDPASAQVLSSSQHAEFSELSGKTREEVVVENSYADPYQTDDSAFGCFIGETDEDIEMDGERTGDEQEKVFQQKRKLSQTTT